MWKKCLKWMKLEKENMLRLSKKAFVTFSVVCLSFAGCCFVTFYTRKAALKAQDALHNIKTLVGVSKHCEQKSKESLKCEESWKEKKTNVDGQVPMFTCVFPPLALTLFNFKTTTNKAEQEKRKEKHCTTWRREKLKKERKSFVFYICCSLLFGCHTTLLLFVSLLHSDITYSLMSHSPLHNEFFSFRSNISLCFIESTSTHFCCEFRVFAINALTWDIT